MGLLNKLFGNNKKPAKDWQGTPDNTKLTELLKQFNSDPNADRYQKAFDELIHGNAMLIIPSINDPGTNDNPNNVKWKTLKEGTTLKLTSIFDIDGLTVLGAFTSTEKLVAWSKKETDYTAMRAKDVLEFCQTHEIDRIVIDSDMPTMFVLERNREGVTTETVQKDTQVKVGTPANPISGEVLERFKQSFSKVSVIEEVYHYAMLRNEEIILMLGFRLDVYNENSRNACIHAIQNAMKGQQLDLPLEMFMLEEDNWLETVQGIDNSLIYTR